MVGFIGWLLGALGLVYLVVGAAIFSRPRRWLHRVAPGPITRLLECATCTSFWVGLVVGYPMGVEVLEWCGVSPGWVLTPWVSPVVGAVVLVGAAKVVQDWLALEWAELNPINRKEG